MNSAKLIIMTRYLVLTATLSACGDDGVPSVKDDPLAAQGAGDANAWARLVGVPQGVSNATEVAITVAVTADSSEYRYKIAEAANTSCADDADYGEPAPTTNVIDTNLKKLDDGPLLLCVLVKDQNGNWPLPDAALTATWSKDSSVPLMQLAAEFYTNKPIVFKTAVEDLSPVTLDWEKLSGPGDITFSSTPSGDTVIDADKEGVYEVLVTTTDAFGYSSSKQTRIVFDRKGPRVTGVKIVSAARTNDPAYAIPGGSGEQLRTVPVALPNRVIISFSEDMTDRLQNAVMVNGTAKAYKIIALSYDAAAATATIDFEASAHYFDAMTVLLKGIADRAGNELDGEWNNPKCLGDPAASNFPSGDGKAGGEFKFFFTVANSDPNLDNKTDLSDVAIVKDNFGASNARYAHGDINGTGTVDLTDYSTVGGQVGMDQTCRP